MSTVPRHYFKLREKALSLSMVAEQPIDAYPRALFTDLYELFMMQAYGTSNVAAGWLYDIPIYGTMAHSYIQAYDDELSAFRAFARQFPHTILLVDTYDTLNGVQAVIELARELGDDFKVGAIRLDSGDLTAWSKGARAVLDTAGLHEVKIIASRGLDEIEGMTRSPSPRLAQLSPAGPVGDPRPSQRRVGRH